MSWTLLLRHLLDGRDLSGREAAWAMDETMAGRATPASLAAFLVALRAKGESVEEMRGLSDMMLAHAVSFAKADEVRALDIVGTGGDGSHSVNISTMSAIVAAGAGVTVVKHGNRAASSSSGSADVLEELGVRLDLSAERVAQIAHECGITFCFAQAFHPSMRHAGPTRREIGVPTAFNFLGPLTNPAQPTYSAVGVGDEVMAPIMAGVFADRGKQAVVFRGDDGLDEVTPFTTTSLWWVADGVVAPFVLDPRRVGFDFAPAEALRGQGPSFNAEIVRSVCGGQAGPIRDAVLLNAGIAMALVGDDAAGGFAAGARRAPTDEGHVHERWAAGIEAARSAIDSGRAARKLDAWVQATQS
ncbi:MAG: anthranilate phosphoribosyltransferase [Ornithinimicrobium sp.]